MIVLFIIVILIALILYFIQEKKYQSRKGINMNKTISEYLKKYYIANCKRIIVTTLRGNKHEICLSKNNKYFYSYTALGDNNVLYLSWFDGIVEFIRQNGGRVEKGNCRNSKVGYGSCAQGTLCYYVATECYGHKIGESSFDPIFIISAILENAGICKNDRGYIQIKAEFLNF